MIAQPLIFGSTDRGAVKGYQLLARYPGIEDQVAQEFVRWVPSHGSLQHRSSVKTVDTESYSYFPVAEGQYAVARSIYGGPEYSGRGGMQVVTIGLLVSQHQFMNYEYDPFHVVNNAKMLGHLVLPNNIPASLKSISLPSRPIIMKRQPLRPHVKGVVVETVDRLLKGQKVIVVGQCNPIHLARNILASVPQTHRAEISFSTGLKLSSRRDFQLQFLQEADHGTRIQLDRQGNHFVEISQTAPV